MCWPASLTAPPAWLPGAQAVQAVAQLGAQSPLVGIVMSIGPWLGSGAAASQMCASRALSPGASFSIWMMPRGCACCFLLWEKG